MCMCMFEHNSGTPGAILTKLGTGMAVCMYKNLIYIFYYIYIIYFIYIQGGPDSIRQFRQQKILSHFPVCCWIDWLLIIKNYIIESGPPVYMNGCLCVCLIEDWDK
jgi:hypothetical protein